jgi:hypothetical protein
MSRLVTVHEIHVTVRVPAALPDPDAAAVRRVILTRAFLTRLKRAARELIARDLSTRLVHIRVSV